jgi:hypothetical protein
MNKIGNALIIDDKIELTYQGNKVHFDDKEYQSLRSIQNYFLKNSIPFSVINQLSNSILDALELMKGISKPDLVVLDLDLDSDGQILEGDRALIRVILNQLHQDFGTFILLIYSSQIDEWSSIRQEVLESEPSLAKILDAENVIIMEKFFDLDAVKSEKLSAEIIQKRQKYFEESLLQLHIFLKSNWNSEVAIIAFFCIAFIVLVYISRPENKPIMFIVASIVILLTSMTFIASNKKN